MRELRLKAAARAAALAALLGGALIAALDGCTVGPDYKPPTVNLPGHYGETAATTQVSRWWSQFHDPTLDSLIRRTMQTNLDLRLASGRLREARASYAIESAGLFPTLNLGGSYSRVRGSSKAFNFGPAGGTGGASGGTSGGGSGGGTSAGGSPAASFGQIGAIGTEIDLWQAGFDARWELDLFGGVRRSVQAARADVEASVEDQRDVLVTLVSEVARHYIEMRGYQKQLQIAQDNLRAQGEIVQLTQELLKTKGTSLDVARARALYANIQATIPTLDAQVKRSIRHLSILMAREPAALRAELYPFRELPYQTPDVPLGIPADLLRRRPDIRRAERQLAAATARIGVAEADLFPRFSLTGSLGTQSQQFKDVASWPARYWSIGPNMSWPIFDAGRIRANIQVQNARAEEALVRYEQAVLMSLEDVENALSAYTQEQARRQSLVAAVVANEEAVKLAEIKYRGQVSDFLEVLDARRSLFAAQDAKAQSERNVASNLVALYKALGGGWETMETK